MPLAIGYWILDPEIYWLLGQEGNNYPLPGYCLCVSAAVTVTVAVIVTVSVTVICQDDDGSYGDT